MDLMGFDYGPEMYDKWHAEAPGVPAISSETSSAYSDRGTDFGQSATLSCLFFGAVRADTYHLQSLKASEIK